MLRTPESGSGPPGPGPTEPRVLRVRIPAGGGSDLGPRAELAPFWTGEAALDRLARRGGSALAAACLSAWLREEGVRGAPPPAPLVLAVGDAVRRGLPTAARLAVASRAPLTGRYADGQVGGDLARRLAGLCDALVIECEPPCEASEARSVLVLGPPPAPGALPGVELLSAGEHAGRPPRELHAALARLLGDVATLCVGPAALAGSPLAALVAQDGEHAHFVGRGGLGLTLVRNGLVALALRAPPERGAPERDAGALELARLLSSSPRLAARAEGGTLELFDDLAARGHGDERGSARAFADELARAQRARHGCRGCPTPCGVVLTSGEEAVGARYGALRALGLELGLEALDDALALQAACNEIGADAKELGGALAGLSLAREAGRAPPGPALRGRRAELLAAIRSVAPAEGGGPVGDGALLAGGVRALEARLGPDAARPQRHAGGGALEGGRGLASLLGQCAASRGADPMRSFPFLAADAVDEEQLARLVAPLPIPAGALDPASPVGKGRLVFWHENLALALDASGFCAFSAAALLADGTASLDQLARALGARDGAAFLATGEQLARLLRRLDVALAGPGAQGLAPELGARLDRPGLWPEYALLRGLDPRGDPTERLARDFAAERPADVRALLAGTPEVAAEAPRETARSAAGSGSGSGRVTLRSGGPLERALGAERTLELELPAELARVLARAAQAVPEAARLLSSPGPVVYRSGERLGPRSLVNDGDVLELLLVISGGAL